MNLDELQSVQSRERQTDSLQQLRASFYKDAAEFVQDLREERDEAAERADDPFDSPDVNRLTDDIRTAEQTVEAIYERRVGKVVKMASLAAADMPTEQEGLTEEEQELFETMVTAIEDHRETILNVLGGESPAGTVAATPTDGDELEATAAEPDDDGIDVASVMGEGDDASGHAAPDEDGPDADRPPHSSGDADVPGDPPGQRSTTTDTEAGDDMDPGGEDPVPAGENGPDSGGTGGIGGSDESDAGSGGDDGDSSNDVAGGDEANVEPIEDDRVTVRITEDVGEIFGVDEREYDLAVDDVVTLPATNAQPLIDRDAAEPLE